MKEKYSDGIEWNTYEKLRKERPELFAESTQIPIVTDKETVDTFVRETGQKVGVMYSSEYHYLLVDLIRNPDGKLYTYERILPVVPSGAAVAVTIQNGLFVLLRQYRHAIRTSQYSFPRGFGEKELSPYENVKKEVHEEIGATVIKCEYLGEVVADSGLLANKVAVFVCQVEGVEAYTGTSEEK